MNRLILILCCSVLCSLLALLGAQARDLQDIRNDGVLRHLAVPYANFVTDGDTGLDIELMRLFAKDLGLSYQYVPTTWKTIMGDLTGRQTIVDGATVTVGEATPIRGDVIASGLTVLPWRHQVIDFSAPTFPTQVWLIASAQSPLLPIRPSGDLAQDIGATKRLLTGKTVFGISGTCLDPKLYDLDAIKANSRLFPGNLNELAPAVLKGEAETTLLDVPDSLVALTKWPGQVKILGPVSEQQTMAAGFRKDSPELQRAFAVFFRKIKENGTYAGLVKKYYPDVFDYYPDFFAGFAPGRAQR